jgi:hypothetical protein
MSTEDIFVQKIEVIRKGEPAGEFDLSFLKEMIYIEPMDLAGPKLILRMHDPNSYLRDKLGLKAKETIEITLADRWGMDGMDVKIRFTIMTAPVVGQMVEYNCFEVNTERLKRPAVECILFTQKPVDAIIKRLLPGMKYDIDPFPVTSDYHILPGTRPSKMLRQIAHEKAAAIWICRGKVYCKTFKALKAKPPVLTYYHQDKTQIEQILQFQKLNSKAVISDAVVRNYMGWDMTKGIVKTINAAKKPLEFVAQVAGLDNLNVVPEPTIDFVTSGNGAIRPGINTKLVWKTDDPEAPIDESLPPIALNGTVAHFYSSQQYYCRVKGIQ